MTGSQPFAWPDLGSTDGTDMVDQRALLAAFQDYSETLLHDFDIGDVLYRLTDQVVDVLSVDGAGVSVARQGDAGLTFVAATDAAIATIEAQQEVAGEGPCHDAYRTGDPVVVADLHGEHRWTSYRRVAKAQGCRAVAGLPMPARERRIGALNLYNRTPRQWSDEELRVSQVLANMASGYVVNQLAITRTRNLASQLQHALESRVVIEQAKGIIAGRTGLHLDAAFDHLRCHARSTGTRLHDLAGKVVDGTAEFPLSPGSDAQR